MNLLEFREFFRKQSGRFDLVDSSFGDSGVDTFIEAGQKYLDRLADLPSGIGRAFVDISAGEWVVKFLHCRSILSVWCIGPHEDDNASRLPLTKYTHEDLRGIDKQSLQNAYVNNPAQITQDRPKFYTPGFLRMVPDSLSQIGGIGAFADVQADGYQTYNSVVFMPPSDGDYSIEILGRFYSDVMSDDEDSTFWSAQHPMILYMAVMRQLEIVHRNSEGVKDWEASIQSEIISLDMDGVAEESSDTNQMEG